MANKLYWRNPQEKYLYWKFKRPAVAAIIVVLDEEVSSLGLDAEVLVIERSPKMLAFPGAFAFPGGFIDTDHETIEQCAIRELSEETGIHIDKCELDLMGVSSDPEGVDPRAHVVNITFIAQISRKRMLECKAGDDAVAVRYVSLKQLLGNCPETKLAFNHNKLAQELVYKVNALSCWNGIRPGQIWRYNDTGQHLLVLSIELVEMTDKARDLGKLPAVRCQEVVLSEHLKNTILISEPEVLHSETFGYWAIENSDEWTLIQDMEK